jgi:hypothetical protein
MPRTWASAWRARLNRLLQSKHPRGAEVHVMARSPVKWQLRLRRRASRDTAMNVTQALLFALIIRYTFDYRRFAPVERTGWHVGRATPRQSAQMCAMSHISGSEQGGRRVDADATFEDCAGIELCRTLSETWTACCHPARLRRVPMHLRRRSQPRSQAPLLLPARAHTTAGRGCVLSATRRSRVNAIAIVAFSANGR